MSKIVEVGDLKIGTGKPKICVPIAASSREDIIRAAEKLLKLPVDIAEWRADYYEDCADKIKLAETLEMLRKTLGHLPILFTLRRQAEGGRVSLSDGEYMDLLKAAAKSRIVDMIDVELSAGIKAISRIALAAHLRGAKLLVSHHDFDATPKTLELAAIFDEMKKSKADIMKVAVMPKNRDDVITLYGVCRKLTEDPLCKPFIAIAMGEEGMISRTAAEQFGSAVTFGSADTETAPGQIRADVLKSLMDGSGTEKVSF